MDEGRLSVVVQVKVMGRFEILVKGAVPVEKYISGAEQAELLVRLLPCTLAKLSSSADKHFLSMERACRNLGRTDLRRQ